MQQTDIHLRSYQKNMFFSFLLEKEKETSFVLVV
jgi:hypothetical protein